jgi:hypothetical protein
MCTNAGAFHYLAALIAEKAIPGEWSKGTFRAFVFDTPCHWQTSSGVISGRGFVSIEYSRVKLRNTIA